MYNQTLIMLVITVGLIQLWPYNHFFINKTRFISVQNIDKI
jgi:hypothetical protein